MTPGEGRAGPFLKVVNGRVKAFGLEEKLLVLSYRNPANRQSEELTLKVDRQTGFNEVLHLKDFRVNDPVSVDYEEIPGGIPRAVRISRVPLRGVPKEISHALA